MPIKPEKIRKMRSSWERMSCKIEKTPGFEAASRKFKVEYELAKELYSARKRANMSQSELAERLGTTQSVISRMESGANVSVVKLREYAEACGGKLEIKIAFS